MALAVVQALVVCGVPHDGAGHGLPGLAAWAVAAFVLVGAAGNLASRSRPEWLVMTPAAVLVCTLTVIVAARG